MDFKELLIFLMRLREKENWGTIVLKHQLYISPKVPNRYYTVDAKGHENHIAAGYCFAGLAVCHAAGWQL